MNSSLIIVILKPSKIVSITTTDSKNTKQ